jgi:hypothetical protein
MDIVVGDVHPVDVLISRPDGSICTPRMVAWQDVATNRLYSTLHILPKGEGIRREHVGESFAAMVRHPEWGMPRHLYLDNGGEYGQLGIVDDAMRLAAWAGDTDPRSDGRRSMIVTAKPYNAPAKPIEGLFAALEKHFRLLPGWIGGNRMVKKSANVGRPPAPFPGDEAELRRAFTAALNFYHTSPQRGSLAGRSPQQAFAAAVAAGWQRIDLADDRALAFAFSRVEQRVVRQGEITIANRWYRAAELLPRSGEKVTVHIPLIDAGADRVFLFDRDGAFLCVADPSPMHHFFDRAGARDKGERTKAQTHQLNAMRQDTEEIDLVAAMEQTAALHPAPAAPASGGQISIHGGWEDAAAADRALPAPADDEERRQAARSKRLQAYTESLEGLRRRAAG